MIQDSDILAKTRELLGLNATIITGHALQPLLKGFRGKQGYALAAVSPDSTTQLYELIKLYVSLNVGYLMQGANTALKGQGTPNGTKENPVIIIRTNLLTQYKILDYPGHADFKILLVEPGVSLKRAEAILNPIGYDLPHKIGSHDLGNTFGASCANGCGGVRVDNRDGRSSMTQSGNMGVVAINANGIIYNGFINKNSITSGKELLQCIDKNALESTDIDLPDINEIDLFLKKLSQDKSYPIHNHRGDIIFSGDGGEGLQVIAYQMYLIRKKPVQIKTFAFSLSDTDLKEKFYKELFFSNPNEPTDSLPILCEAMNANMVKAIVQNGIGYLNAILLARAPLFIGKYTHQLLKIRDAFIRTCPSMYIGIESFIGKILSKMFTPKAIRALDFKELLIIQMANRNSVDNIDGFQKKVASFISKNRGLIEILDIKAGSFEERLLLQIRTVSAITTLTIAQQEKGELFAFDDAIMPGNMLHQYCDVLYNKLTEKYPGRVSEPYVYGHDLKQINHNDWIIKQQLSENESKEIHHLQHQLVEEIGGIPHAEHGVGDYSDTDLNRDSLVKLVAHRLLNDFSGLANPNGGPDKAFKKALLDNTIVTDGIVFAQKALNRELERGTLFTWVDKNTRNLTEHLDINIKKTIANNETTR